MTHLDEGETSGPGSRLCRGEGDLEERERLEFADAPQRSGVNRGQAVGSDYTGELCLGVRAGDQDRHVLLFR